MNKSYVSNSSDDAIGNSFEFDQQIDTYGNILRQSDTVNNLAA